MGVPNEPARPRNDELLPHRAILEGIEQQAGTLRKVDVTANDENAKIVQADAAAGLRVLCRVMARSALSLVDRVDMMRRLSVAFHSLVSVDYPSAYSLRKLIEDLQARSYRDVICGGCRPGQTQEHKCEGQKQGQPACQCALCRPVGISSGK